MKKYHIYISLFIALLLSSCANDIYDVSEVTEQETEEGIAASIPELIDGNAANGDGATSRSTLIYDKTAKKTLFSWGDNDAEAYMCVFPLNENVSTGQKDAVAPQVFTRMEGQDITSLNCRFQTADGVKTLPYKKDGAENPTKYISFRPYPDKTKEINYLKKEISYEGQKNHNNVMMAESFATTDNLVTYKKSEADAASHIGAYDYLVSVPTTTEAEGHVYFSLKRVGVSARFYLKCPAAEVFEELQLVTHNAELFTLEGTMDLSSMKVTDTGHSISINPTKQSNVIVLGYDYDAKDPTNHPGLDMTDKSSKYYYNNIGYIVSYMMLPPVDLSKEGSTVNLYLVSHDSSGNKKYYKSAPLKTPKLTSNMFYQWTSANNSGDVDPIKFQEVTVQEWKEDTAISNGDSGTGTEGW